MRASVAATVSSIGANEVVLTCYPSEGEPIAIRVPLDRMPPGTIVFGAGATVYADPNAAHGYGIAPRTMHPPADPELEGIEAWLASLPD